MGLQYNYQLMLANATQGQIFSPVSFTRTNRWGCRKHGAQSFLLMYMAEIDPFPSRTAFLYIYIFIYIKRSSSIFISGVQGEDLGVVHESFHRHTSHLSSIRTGEERNSSPQQRLTYTITFIYVYTAYLYLYI